MTQNANLSHTKISQKPSSNLGESVPHLDGLEGSRISQSPQRTTQQNKRIPKGIILTTIPLDAAKMFASRLWTGTGIEPRILYADRNSKGENITLTAKYLPDGAETAPHPQIVFYLKGMYHVEEISYNNTNPHHWITWAEFHIDAKDILQLVNALLKAHMQTENNL